MTQTIHSGSNVLVWGALGFLGQHLVKALLDRGARVSVICRPRRLYANPPWADCVRWFEIDGMEDAATLLAAVSSADLIYDLAGSSGAVASNLDPADSLNANCAAQLAFLAACEKAGHCPRVVFASSWLVYDIDEAAPISEAHSVAPRSMYAAHKLCIEHYLRIFANRGKLTYTVCRVSNPYGCDYGKPTQAYKILNSFVQCVLAGAPVCVFGDGRQLRDFLYISDLIDAFLLCASPAARNETFNISHGTSHSLIDAVETIMQIAGRTPVIYKPWPEEYGVAESGSYIADIRKARAKLGFDPNTQLHCGLTQTVRELQARYISEKAASSGAYA